MTLINPDDLMNDLDRLEGIEKASLRFVAQALYDYRREASIIFHAESDQVADIGEDITREALDRLGMPKVDQRLFGKVDYKRACYVFQPEFAIRQALFVDSKAEEIGGKGTATLQISQLSMTVKQVRSGSSVSVPGKLPQVLLLNNDRFLTTTIFVKYTYTRHEHVHHLMSITVAAVPNGMLQERYNPHEQDSIWLAGRNAPSLGEEFRVRLSFRLLKHKARWRVQHIPVEPHDFSWDE